VASRDNFLGILDFSAFNLDRRLFVHQPPHLLPTNDLWSSDCALVSGDYIPLLEAFWNLSSATGIYTPKAIDLIGVSDRELPIHCNNLDNEVRLIKTSSLKIASSYPGLKHLSLPKAPMAGQPDVQAILAALQGSQPAHIIPFS
jgi:hypothetical protein